MLSLVDNVPNALQLNIQVETCNSLLVVVPGSLEKNSFKVSHTEADWLKRFDTTADWVWKYVLTVLQTKKNLWMVG